ALWSSVEDMRLVLPESWATKVRPSRESVARIGSRVRRLVRGKLTSCQKAVAGACESSKLTRRVSSPARNITLPVNQLTPTDGSPAPVPTGSGAGQLA